MQQKIIGISNMPWPAILLISIQSFLLLLFSSFAFFNYLYAFASLWKPQIKRTSHSGRRIAVVIVSFNEKYVIEDTITACDKLTYPKKLTILADDSDDPEVIENLRDLARSRGCQLVHPHPFSQDVVEPDGSIQNKAIEIWESPDFVLFHRPDNTGFKSGSLCKVIEYLEMKNLELMYLLDADWHPQIDALERTLEVLEANNNAAFIQTKRASNPSGMNLFQKYVTLVEEGCYYVDFEGRQVLGHPTLFSGCCTLFRLDAIDDVGGFNPGHLTEDLDLTDRLWLNGWKGIYVSDVVNYGEVPFTYDHFRRQQERWAAGSGRAFKEYFWPILRTHHLSWFQKLAAIRQNAYFTSTLLTGIAIIIGMTTVMWLVMAWNSYAVEYYLYVLGNVREPFLFLLYWCILSNFIEPLIMVLVKKRSYRDLIHLPMMVWYTWSIIPTYVIGNIKGLTGVRLDWFRTPKPLRDDTTSLPSMPNFVRILNIFACTIALGVYFSEGWHFGWFDEFSLLIIPAFLLASLR